MTTRNRKTRRESSATRHFILDLRRRWPWYRKPLTVEDIREAVREAMDWKPSEKTIDRHLKALRDGGHLDTDTSDPPAPL